MQRPKRTNEFCETPATNNRQSRQSRIPTIPTRSSYQHRSSSADRGLSMNAFLSAPQSLTKVRSSSATPTPQRTPKRSQSPSTYLTSGRILTTAEKIRPPAIDKKWIQTQMARITEHLQSIAHSHGLSNFSGNLKTMSTKQFIAILNYFLSVYARKRFVIDPSNYVESTMRILTQIEYPYTMNKSWLKTPTAPHAFNNVLLLFSFFMDFVPSAENKLQFIRDHHICSEEFPDIDFARKIMLKEEEGFDLWDSQKNDEFEALQNEVIDNLVLRKTSLESVKKLDEEISRLNAKLKQCMNDFPAIDNEGEYVCLEKEASQVEKKINEMQKEIEENHKEFQILRDQIELEKKEMNKLLNNIAKLRAILNEQEISVEMRDKIIKEIHQLKMILNTKMTSNEELQKHQHSNEVKITRLLQQVSEEITNFNKYGRRVVEELQKHMENIDLEDLTLQRHSSDDADLESQLQRISEVLVQLKKITIEDIDKCKNNQSSYEKGINLKSYEIEKYLRPNLELTQKSIEEEQINVEQLNHKLIDLTNSEKHLDANLNELNDKLTALRDVIASNKNEAERMKKINETFLDDFETKWNNIMDFRECVADRTSQAIDKLEKKLDEFNANILKETQEKTNNCLEAKRKLDDHLEQYKVEAIKKNIK